MRNKYGPRIWLFAAGAVILLAGIAWSQRLPVLRWYYLRELAAATEDSRASWVERAISLDTAVAPGLLNFLQDRDPTVCNNAEQALAALVKRWGAEDARTVWLADEFRERFGNLSPLGQISTLQLMTAVLQQEGPKTWPAVITRSAGELLQACRDRPELRCAALGLASALLDRVPPGQWLDTCRTLADRGLSDKLPRARLAAVQLLMRPALQGETALLVKVAPMLRDPKAPLRRAAVVALAPARSGKRG